MAQPTIKLNSGHAMPQIGFGLWKVDNATCADTVYNAIKAGYRLFDGACGKPTWRARHSTNKTEALTTLQITATRRRPERELREPSRTVSSSVRISS
jgi:D-xylose reductase